MSHVLTSFTKYTPLKNALQKWPFKQSYLSPSKRQQQRCHFTSFLWQAVSAMAVLVLPWKRPLFGLKES